MARPLEQGDTGMSLLQEHCLRTSHINVECPGQVLTLRQRCLGRLRWRARQLLQLPKLWICIEQANESRFLEKVCHSTLYDQPFD